MASEMLQDHPCDSSEKKMLQPDASRGINNDPLLEFFSSVAKHWILISAASVLFIVAAIYMHLTTAPLYEAETVVSDNDPSLPSSLIGTAQVTGTLSLGSLMGTEKSITVAHITSIQAAKRFIVSSGLMNEPFIKSAIEQRKFEYPVPPEELAAKFLIKNVVSARKDSKTGLIGVSFRWPDPNRSSELLEAYIDSVDAAIKEDYIQAADTAVVFLEESLSRNRKREFDAAIVSHYQKAIQPLVFGDAPGRFAIRTIDPATTPLDSTRPSIIVYVLAGLLSGIFFGITVMLILMLAKKMPSRHAK